MPGHCTPHEHLSRRALLKGALATTAGGAVANFGGLFNSQTIAAEAAKQGKRCILLWMNGGASQIDTFDMKPGRSTAGPFREMPTKLPGYRMCEYLPKMAQLVGKLGIIRSMKTQSPDHPDGIYHMHTCYKQSERTPHPELGAMIAKYCGNPDADLPSFVRMGPCGNAGAGYLGPKYEPFSLGRDGKLPYFTNPYLEAKEEERRNELLRFMEAQRSKRSEADPFENHRIAKERSWRLLRAKGLFDTSKDWPAHEELYGKSDFGRGCFLARKLVEQGVPFVEVGQDNYDSHADNFVCHKANMQVLDPAWSGLLIDLERTGQLDRTLVVWMGEVGRTPSINNRAGRDHYINAWTIVLAGGGIKGGVVYGKTDADGRQVEENPVGEGDLFATIYHVLGMNHRVKHYIGPRPVWATPEGSKPVKDLIA